MTGGFVAVSVADGIGRLRLTRAEKRNAISHAVVDEVEAGMRELVGRGVRVAVLEADAPTFCSGNDLSEIAEMTDAASTAVVRLLDAVLTHPLFWLGSVSGPALGGGVAVVAACPVAIAADDAWFALTENRIGLFPSGVLPYLEAVMGARAAFGAGLFGQPISAAEAVPLGLVDETCRREHLEDRVDELARVLAAQPEVTDAGRRVWQQRFRTAGFVERQRQLDAVLEASRRR